MKSICLIIFFSVFISDSVLSQQKNQTELMEALKSGNHFIMMRHAIAPGLGDPSNFEIGDCSTQRNLSENGKAQSEKIGAFLRENGISDVQVFSSEWCRCVETAELLNVGKVKKFPAINSFFRNQSRRDLQTDELRTFLENQDLSEPIVLVSHQVNITAFTGIFPASGEMIVIRKKEDNAGFEVIGRLRIED